MKMRAWIGTLLPGLAVALAASRSGATVYNGWADKFLGYYVDCRSYTNSAIACALGEQWLGQGAWSPPTWTVVGMQGANAGGRANAEEQVMFRFRDAHAGSYTATTTLSRYRTTTPPAEGSSCSGGSFVASVSETFTSTQFQPADWYLNNRMIPVMNFSAETAGAGTTIGYRSVVQVSADAGGTPNVGTNSGCYKIRWI
jgi:hypothetical protein